MTNVNVSIYKHFTLVIILSLSQSLNMLNESLIYILIKNSTYKNSRPLHESEKQN